MNVITHNHHTDSYRDSLRLVSTKNNVDACPGRTFHGKCRLSLCFFE